MLSIASSSLEFAAPGGQFQLQAARRAASQSEQTARALEAQAQAAQRSADQEQARADGLTNQASQAGQRSDLARRNVSSIEMGVQRDGTAFATGRTKGVLLDTFA